MKAQGGRWCGPLGCANGVTQQTQTVQHHQKRAAFVTKNCKRQGQVKEQSRCDQNQHGPDGKDQVLSDDPQGAARQAVGGS